MTFFSCSPLLKSERHYRLPRLCKLFCLWQFYIIITAATKNMKFLLPGWTRGKLFVIARSVYATKKTEHEEIAFENNANEGINRLISELIGAKSTSLFFFVVFSVSSWTVQMTIIQFNSELNLSKKSRKCLYSDLWVIISTNLSNN